MIDQVLPDGTAYLPGAPIAGDSIEAIAEHVITFNRIRVHPAVEEAGKGGGGHVEEAVSALPGNAEQFYHFLDARQPSCQSILSI